jgi:hypothetical protein
VIPSMHHSVESSFNCDCERCRPPCSVD